MSIELYVAANKVKGYNAASFKPGQVINVSGTQHNNGSWVVDSATIEGMQIRRLI